jgi:23S rRNA pseudouridine1911/1915/1917 synthase
MHRLDYETNGLVLFAKNEKSYKYFKSLQDNGKFIKEYSAICLQSPSEITDSSSGFPPCPLYLENFIPSSENPFVIESFFRPFGPGRKLVRPVIADGKKHREVAADKGGHYRTEITGIDKNIFTIRLRRGFRHQIRCHLSWIGFPVLNDPLYPIPLTVPESNELALRSHALFFTDPSGRVCEYRIKPLEKS